MSEQDQYGSLKSAAPIDITRFGSPQGSHIVSTLGMQPSRAATQAYHAQIQRDLVRERQQREQRDDS